MKGTRSDEDAETNVPFQIAYAVSIHKAQGLEYNSVKIVITKEVDEMITHNIFYTALYTLYFAHIVPCPYPHYRLNYPLLNNF